MRFNIVVKVSGFNDGKNKYALAVSDEHLKSLVKAYKEKKQSILINGSRFILENIELIKIFRIKQEYNEYTDDQFREAIRKDAFIHNRGKLTIPLLRAFSEEVTSKYIDADTEDTLASDDWGLIHEKISEVSKAKFQDGYYSDSVLSAFVEINDIVKKEFKRITISEEDGPSLMRKAFSPSKPIVKLTDLSTESARNIQDGYMNIFAGVMIGIRNPKAHGNIKIDVHDAWEKIVLASHLLKIWDKRVKE